MSWEDEKQRWVKMYKGVRYRVTCEDLRAPLNTKDASYKLANEWWKRKEAELNRPDPTTERLLRYELADLQDLMDKSKAAQRMFTLKTEDPSLREMFYTPNIHDHIVRSVDERLGKDVAPPDKLLEAMANKFLAVELARKKAPGTYGDLAYYISRL